MQRLLAAGVIVVLPDFSAANWDCAALLIAPPPVPERPPPDPPLGFPNGFPLAVPPPCLPAWGEGAAASRSCCRFAALSRS